MSDDTPPKGVQFGTHLPNTGVTILEDQLEICWAQRKPKLLPLVIIKLTRSVWPAQ